MGWGTKSPAPSYNTHMKFATLHLRNFQSHPDTLVELSPGINAFVGASDQGKTAMIRGLKLVANNSPTGDSIISDWARDAEGKLLSEFSVTVTTDEARTIRRIKSPSPKRNGYDLDSTKYDAVRTSVPPEVQAALNLEPVNWQSQMDPPFLLADSGGERARFFNQLIRLEVIEKYLSAAEALRRKVTNAIQPLQEAVLAEQERIDGLAWIEGTDDKAKALEAVIAERDAVDVQLTQLRLIRERIQQADAEIERITPHVDLAQSVLGTLKGVQGELAGISRKVNTIKPLISGLKDAEAKLANTSGLAELQTRMVALKDAAANAGRVEERLAALRAVRRGLKDADYALLLPVPGDLAEKVQRLRTYVGALLTTKTKRDALGSIVVQVRKATLDISEMTETIQSIREQFPDICPLCNGTGSLKGAHCG